MSDEEKKLLEATADLTNRYVELVKYGSGSHPCDLDEFTTHIHAIQRLIAVRATRRQHPEIFRTGA